MTTQFIISQQSHNIEERAINMAIFISMLQEWLPSIPITCTILNAHCTVTTRDRLFQFVYNPMWQPRATASLVIRFILQSPDPDAQWPLSQDAHTRAYQILHNMMIWRRIPDN